MLSDYGLKKLSASSHSDVQYIESLWTRPLYVTMWWGRRNDTGNNNIEFHNNFSLKKWDNICLWTTNNSQIFSWFWCGSYTLTSFAQLSFTIPYHFLHLILCPHWKPVVVGYSKSTPFALLFVFHFLYHCIL